jgi:hypothetical protein
MLGLPPDTPITGQVRPKRATAASPSWTTTTPPANPPAPPASDPNEIVEHSLPPLPSPIQRAVHIDEISTSVNPPDSETSEASIDEIAFKVMDILRQRLKREQERFGKF